ncbi:MAG: hypothetical protein ACI8V2_005301 [Candidatus Latescibacterota bacterium]|jgi:hypothetical protein
MAASSAPKPRSLGELISGTKVPANTVGIFWPGGSSLVFKSVRQRVYIFDPMVASWASGSRVGPIDIRPDLVFCSVAPGEHLDLPALTHLASAFPEARFVSSASSRDAMIGRNAKDVWDEIPIEPGRVHALEQELRLDVRQVGVGDSLRVRVLHGVDGNLAPPWNLLLSFSGVQVCLIQRLNSEDEAKEICEAIRRRVDVLLWSFPGAHMSFAADLLDQMRPGYAIPFAYDRLPNGGERARKFRDLATRTPGVKTYLFAEDYMEGLLYSRIMSRKSRF